jgi:hypothetical protein
MRTRAEMLKIDRTAIKVTSIKSSDNNEYWQSRPIQTEHQKLVQSAMKLSENSFSKVWDNAEDAIYDE